MGGGFKKKVTKKTYGRRGATNKIISLTPGFPNWGRLVGEGDNSDKMAKNCMKMTKSTFWGQNSGGGTLGGQANFLGSGGDLPQSSPTRGNPALKIFLYPHYFQLHFRSSLSYQVLIILQ